MEQDRLKNLSDEYRRNLQLQGYPAAMKMVEDIETLDDILYKGRPVRRINKNLFVCQLIAQARFYGRVVAGEDKYLGLCRMGADALGFEHEDYAHIYSGSYFSTEEAAKKMIETMPKLEKGKYHGMLVAPLDRIPLEPDVIVIYGNAAQMLRIINGYLYDKGGRLEFSASGDAGLCSDTLTIPLMTGKPHLAIPCNGGRMVSLPNETELAFGIPLSVAEDILEGIRYTGRNVPVMFPTAWQHIDWEPPSGSPIRAFVSGEQAAQKKKEA